MQKTLVWAVLALFGAFSVFVVVSEGYFGFIELALRERWGGQIFIDLCIALSMVLAWLVPDARRRGMRAWPWILGTLLLGSLAPLLYLAVRRAD